MERLLARRGASRQAPGTLRLPVRPQSQLTTIPESTTVLVTAGGSAEPALGGFDDAVPSLARDAASLPQLRPHVGEVTAWPAEGHDLVPGVSRSTRPRWGCWSPAPGSAGCSPGSTTTRSSARAGYLARLADGPPVDAAALVATGRRPSR